MEKFVVHVHVEISDSVEVEPLVTETMAKFGFYKDMVMDGGDVIHLAPWLYTGESNDSDVAIATRLRSMLHLATQEELAVLVMPGKPLHLAHTQGSLVGIAHLEPDLN